MKNWDDQPIVLFKTIAELVLTRISVSSEKRLNGYSWETWRRRRNINTWKCKNHTNWYTVFNQLVFGNISVKLSRIFQFITMLIVYGLLAVHRNITSWKQREVQEGSTPEKRMTTKLICYNHSKLVDISFPSVVLLFSCIQLLWKCYNPFLCGGLRKKIIID